MSPGQAASDETPFGSEPFELLCESRGALLEWLLVVAPHVSVDHNVDFFLEEVGRLEDISRTVVASPHYAAL